jgi:hypothetical protein
MIILKKKDSPGDPVDTGKGNSEGRRLAEIVALDNQHVQKGTTTPISFALKI